MKPLPILPALFLLALAACAGSGPAREAPGQSAARSETPPRYGERLLEFEGSIRSDLPLYTFTLTGAKPEADSAPARVQTIEIRRAAGQQPIQVISGLEAETPIDRPGAFELLDMNFDGYADIRLIEFLPAGPNIPYRNWLFESATGNFESSPELDAITSAVFDRATETIRSAWRDGPSRYGEDTYRYVEGRPILVRREERLYTEPGVYRLTISERANGELKAVVSRIVRE